MMEKGIIRLILRILKEKARNERTKLFILCNPHNPTGRIFKNEELKRLSDICAENNVIIVADEIHGDLIRKGQTFTPIAKVAVKYGSYYYVYSD